MFHEKTKMFHGGTYHRVFLSRNFRCANLHANNYAITDSARYKLYTIDSARYNPLLPADATPKSQIYTHLKVHNTEGPGNQKTSRFPTFEYSDVL